MMNFCRTNLLIFILVLFCAPSMFEARSLAQERTEWLTGSKLTKTSQTLAVSVEWQGAPLRQRLAGLSRRQRVSIFLDRRVDGSQTVDFSVNNVSLEECLWRLCEKLDLGMCRVDDVYYVGPRVAAANLPQQLDSLKKQVDGADRQTRRRWERAESLTIPRLAQPRELILLACQNAGANLEKSEEIPHDLWAETDLPVTETVTRLSLLLVGFGKTIELNDNLVQVRLADLPARDSVTRVFQLGANAKKGAKLIEAEMPGVQFDSKKRSLVVTTSAEESLQVHRLLVSMQAPKVADLSRQVFTLKMTNKRKTILEAIANQLDREFLFRPNHVQVLNERIELDLKDTPVEQVIGAVLANTGLGFRITDERLEIVGGAVEPNNEKRR